MDDEGLGGPLWSPAGWGGGRVSPRYQRDEQDAGDHKGPPNPASAALAPTDGDADWAGLAPALYIHTPGVSCNAAINCP